MIPGSEEWFAARCGFVTASRIADVMATIKSGEAASRRNYRAQIVAERMAGISENTYTSPAMQWGIDHEQQAADAYAFLHDVEPVECGFILHPTIEWTGATPDRLIGEDGLLEIKCPNTATHIDTLLTGNVDNRYVLQMLWQMECTGREWCDFVSFDPRMPPRHQLFCKRFNRDAFSIMAGIRTEVVKFLGEVEEVINRLENRE